jgi:hypothetical protein
MRIFAFLALALTFLTGCVTVQNNAYVAGRITARTYTLQKDAGKIDEKTQKALVESYKALSAVVAKDSNQFSADLKKLVIDNISEHVKDNTIKLVAIDLVEIYWGQLMAEVDFDKLQSKDAWRALKEFHRGIEEALELKKLLESTSNSMHLHERDRLVSAHTGWRVQLE